MTDAQVDDPVKKEEAEVDKFCNNDSCEIIPTTGDNDDQDYAN